MDNRQIRVLVVDDSALVRELICDALSVHQDIEIVGVAADGEELLAMLDDTRPDIITLDLHMPRLGGLETLDRLLATRPIPVIVVSSLTQRAADTTMEALERGALDYVAKPTTPADMQRVFGEDLPWKIRNMAGADVARILRYRKSRAVRAGASQRIVDSEPLSRYAAGCIAIGVSTGGPPALSTLFECLVPPLPPIVIVQHMPAMFTGPFAGRLDSISSLCVKEAADGDVLQPNCAYVSPGGVHLELQPHGQHVVVNTRDGDFVSGHKPSVDVMMASAAAIYGPRCLGAIMTGMGRDGALGCRAIRAAGGLVLGQDQATSDVYGMNKVAFAEGNVDRQVPLDRLADSIIVESRKRCTCNDARVSVADTAESRVRLPASAGATYSI